MSLFQHAYGDFIGLKFKATASPHIVDNDLLWYESASQVRGSEENSSPKLATKHTSEQWPTSLTRGFSVEKKLGLQKPFPQRFCP